MTATGQYTITAVYDGGEVLNVSIRSNGATVNHNAPVDATLTAEVRKGERLLAADEIAENGRVSWFVDGNGLPVAEGPIYHAQTNGSMKVEAKLETFGETLSGDVVSFQETDGDRTLRDLVVSISPAQSGTGDPSPTNIRPISGFNSINVYDDPAYGGTIKWNQLVMNGNFASGTTKWQSSNSSMEVSNGVVTVTNTGTGNYYLYPVSSARYSDIGDHVVFVSFQYKISDSNKNSFRASLTSSINNNRVFLINTYENGVWYTAEGIFQFTSGSYVNNQIRIGQVKSATTSSGNSFSVKNVRVHDLTAMFGAGNEPGTVADFKALFPDDYYDYNVGEFTCVSAVNGDSYQHAAVDLGETRYGGTLNIGTGKLIVDKGISTFTGAASEPWYWTAGTGSLAGKYRAYTSYAPFPGIASASTYVADFMSNLIKPDIAGGSYPTNVWSGCFNSNRSLLIGVPSSITSVEDWRTFLASNNLQVVYPLANPVEVSLSPAQIKTIQGRNHVWSDAGSVSFILDTETLAWAETMLAAVYDGAQSGGTYLHVKYSPDGGATFTASNGEVPGPWIGTYTDTTQADSDDPSDYTWTRFVEDGEAMAQIRVVSTSVGELRREMEQSYVAKSDFGDYTESVKTEILETAKNVVESYEYTSAIQSLNADIGELSGLLTELNGEIRRGYIVDPDTQEEAIGIAISQQLQVTGSTRTVDGVEYCEFTPGQTLGIYTSTGWQFWVNGSKRGWFDSEDGMLHAVNSVMENSLKVGSGWQMTASGGFGLRYTGS